MARDRHGRTRLPHRIAEQMMAEGRTSPALPAWLARSTAVMLTAARNTPLFTHNG